MISSHRHTTSQRPLLSLRVCSRRRFLRAVSRFTPPRRRHVHTARWDVTDKFFFYFKTIRRISKMRMSLQCNVRVLPFLLRLVLGCLPFRIPPVQCFRQQRRRRRRGWAKSIGVRTLKLLFGESSLESPGHNSIISGINRRCWPWKQCEQQSNKMCYSVCILKFMGRRDESSSFV